ncbi:MAG TPA: NAD-dependent epimerase/dehydratase family protein [Ignavibacteria bacterium]|nr:NAD-dependent epimerase/dehydratase family protein [Ignavibacteria bacterium]
MAKTNKTAVFGGSGMLGSAVVRRLEAKGYKNIYAVSKDTEFDLLNKQMVDDFLINIQPDYLYMVAGLVGGILANSTRQADFLYQNALMILYTLESIKEHSPKTKILYTGSTCIYPKENPQPINESRFMAGPLEETNKGYAMAKGMGIVACELYRNQYGINTIEAMPTNMYGPKDNYNLQSSHFFAATIIKMVKAKREGVVPVFWGTGRPRREALYVEDCADALIYLMENYNDSKIVNIGTGVDNTISEYVETVRNLVGYDGDIKWDVSKPDGMFQKMTDISYLKTIMPEYKPRSFEEGARHILKTEFGF